MESQMSTPISQLQMNQTNIPRLVKNVERNIESMRTLDNNYVPQYPQQNMPYIPSQQFVYPQIPVYPHQLYAQQHYKNPSTFKQKFGSIKEPLVILLLFSLLAHKKIGKFVDSSIPFLKDNETPIPSLLTRGLIMVIILFLIKKLL